MIAEGSLGTAARSRHYRPAQRILQTGLGRFCFGRNFLNSTDFQVYQHLKVAIAKLTSSQRNHKHIDVLKRSLDDSLRAAGLGAIFLRGRSMRIDQIESVLGSAIIDQMQAMTEKVLLTSGDTSETCAALIDLLLAQIASVIDVGTDDNLCVERAEDCAKRLVALVEAMAEIKHSASDKTDERGLGDRSGPRARASTERVRLN